MKKIYIIYMLFSIIVLIGCGKKKENVASGSGNIVSTEAILSSETNKIELTDVTITLPTGMNFGKKIIDNESRYYIWEGDSDYIMPNSSDIIMYIYEGNDKNSPDRELTDSQARNSFTQTYVNSFKNEVENARLNLDANIVSTDSWYTLCFTGYSGESVITTYNVYCYPKSYYGIYMLQKNINTDNSRNYYGFVFTNNSKGDLMEEDDYNSLLNQIKSGFEVSEFYTLPQNELSYDATKDYSNGYSYSQLLSLFNDTKNFYIIAEGGTPQTIDVNEEEIKDKSIIINNKTYYGGYKVVRVIDGDTIILSMNNEEKIVRLIGVDTPESVHPNESRNTQEGRQASKRLSEILDNKEVYIEYDVDKEDDYGRTLAYVYLIDEEVSEKGKTKQTITMVNEVLLKEGIATTLTIQPNSRYANEFYALQVAAREGKVGFWGTGFFFED